MIQKGFLLLLCAAPILCTHFVSPSQNQVSFSCDLGCVLAIVLPILYFTVLGHELRRLLPQFTEHCVCIGASMPNLLRVCIACLSQLVCVKLSGAPSCVFFPRVCVGKEYRGKVYALLVSTRGTSHVLLVPSLRSGFEHLQAYRYRENFHT